MATIDLTSDGLDTGRNIADKPSRRRYVAVVPMIIWILLLVALPNLYLLVYSFWTSSLGTVDHSFTLENYKSLFDSEVFRLLFKRTLTIALASSLIATVIAYAMALIVVRKFGRYKLLAALLILIPLWVSYLMRIFRLEDHPRRQRYPHGRCEVSWYWRLGGWGISLLPELSDPDAYLRCYPVRLSQRLHLVGPHTESPT